MTSIRAVAIRLVLVLGGLAAGVLLLALMELAMRGLDLGADPGLFTPELASDGTRTMRLSWNPQFQRPQPPQPQRSFLAQKPPGTFRIFVVGESSAEGVPYGTAFAFSSWLERRLEVQVPEIRWEVVNAAVAGATSSSMLVMASEIAKYAPDLLVVYLGHNEVGARLTPAERARLDPDDVDWRRFLGRMRLYRLLASALPRQAKRLDLPGPDDPVGRMGSPRDYASDADRAVITRAYRARLEEIVGVMRNAGAGTALLTLSQNFSDWPPAVSIHRRRLGREEKRAWRTAVRRGRALAPHDCAGALAAWRTALALDDGFAMLHFEVAGCERRLGRLDEARAHYRMASELDSFTQGALLSFNTILGEVAQREGAILVDVDAALTRASGDRLVGDDLFADAMHPNLRAHQLIAEAVADALWRADVPVPADRWRIDAYVDPDPEAVLAANPGLRAMEHVTYALACHAADRTPCVVEHLDAALHATTDATTRRNIEHALSSLAPAGAPTGTAESSRRISGP